MTFLKQNPDQKLNLYEGETAIIYKDFVYFFEWKLTRKTSTVVTIIILCSNVMQFFLSDIVNMSFEQLFWSYVYNNQKNVFLHEVFTIDIDLTYITLKCNEIQHSKIFIHKFPWCKWGGDTPPLSPRNKV